MEACIGKRAERVGGEGKIINEAEESDWDRRLIAANENITVML
jgi:hypothetical protein